MQQGGPDRCGAALLLGCGVTGCPVFLSLVATNGRPYSLELYTVRERCGPWGLIRSGTERKHHRVEVENTLTLDAASMRRFGCYLRVRYRRFRLRKAKLTSKFAVEHLAYEPLWSPS